MTRNPNEDEGIQGSIITPERLKRALEMDSDAIEVAVDGMGHVRFARSFAFPLDFYFRKRLILGREHRAGCDFHRLWRDGCVRSGYVQTRYDVRQENKAPGDSFLRTETEYQAARLAIRNHRAREIAYMVCCVGEKAGRGNMDLLREALADLYDHFRALNEEAHKD